MTTHLSQHLPTLSRTQCPAMGLLLRQSLCQLGSPLSVWSHRLFLMLPLAIPQIPLPPCRQLRTALLQTLQQHQCHLLLLLLQRHLQQKLSQLSWRLGHQQRRLNLKMPQGLRQHSQGHWKQPLGLQKPQGLRQHSQGRWKQLLGLQKP